MSARGERLRVFTGTAHPKLAQDICSHMGVPLGAASLQRFPDGEIKLKVECDVRGADVFVVQPTCPPVHENLFELLSYADCLRRASADRITAVIPYYGYARKDRKDEGRVPINAKLVANLLVASGYTRVVAIDLHAAQIQGFFDIPVDHLFARPVLIERVRQLGADKPVVVSPDVGGVKLARAYAKDLEHIIGEVKGRDVLLVDDMVSTGGSIVDAARIVKQKGANAVFLVATHAVLAGKAVERLNNADVEKILFADTIPLPDSKITRLETVSIAQLLARAIDRIHRSESVSKLFETDN